MIQKLIQVVEEEIREHPLYADFRKAFPGWQIRFCEMDDDEVICWDTRVIWLAMWRWPDPYRRAAHAVAHLKIHGHVGREFTDDECSAADDLGQCWLIGTAAVTRAA